MFEYIKKGDLKSKLPPRAPYDKYGQGFNDCLDAITDLIDEIPCEEGCDLCNNPDNLLSEITVPVAPQGRSFPDGAMRVRLIEVEARFCPKCGRELSTVSEQ